MAKTMNRMKLPVRISDDATNSTEISVDRNRPPQLQTKHEEPTKSESA